MLPFSSSISALLYLILVNLALKSRLSDAVEIKWCGSQPPPLGPDAVRQVPQELQLEKRPFQVELTPGSIKCPPGVSGSVVRFTYNGTSNGTSGDNLLKVIPMLSIKLSNTGYIQLDNFYYPKEGYCVKEWTPELPEYVSFSVCGNCAEKDEKHKCITWDYANNCGGNICVPKCCKLHTIQTDNGTMATGDGCKEPFRNASSVFKAPVFYDSVYSKSEVEGPVHFYVNHELMSRGAFPHAHENHPVDRSSWKGADRACFRIRPDGVLLLREVRDHLFHWKEVQRKDYCLDGFQMSQGSSAAATPYEGHEYHYGVGLLQRGKDPPVKDFYMALYSSASLLSTIFPILTFSVYFLLRDQVAKPFGWIAISHSLTLGFVYLLRGLMYFLQPVTVSPVQRNWSCVVLGIAGHLFVLANASWLLILSINFLWSFGSCKIRNGVQFASYAALGWGLPSLFVACVAYSDFAHGYDHCGAVLTAEYGATSCFVSSRLALDAFVYYPGAGFHGGALAVLGLGSALLLWRQRSSSWKRWGKGSTTNDRPIQSKDQLRLFWLTAKLNICLGLSFVLEVVVTWCGYSNSTWYKLALGCLTFIQALAFFLIYITERNTLKALKATYPEIRPFLSFTNKYLMALELEKEDLGGRHYENTAYRRNRSDSMATASTSIDPDSPSYANLDFYGDYEMDNSSVNTISTSEYVRWNVSTAF